MLWAVVKVSLLSLPWLLGLQFRLLFLSVGCLTSCIFTLHMSNWLVTEEEHTKLKSRTLSWCVFPTAGVSLTPNCVGSVMLCFISTWGNLALQGLQRVAGVRCVMTHLFPSQDFVQYLNTLIHVCLSVSGRINQDLLTLYEWSWELVAVWNLQVK